MGFGSVFAGINWLAVIVATVAAFSLGGLWYSKSLFGDNWMSEVGLTEDALNTANFVQLFGGAFALQFVAATALAVMLGRHHDWWAGLRAGLLIGVCVVAPAYGITYLFEQRTRRLFMINAGYYVVLFAIMGTIIGAWR